METFGLRICCQDFCHQFTVGKNYPVQDSNMEFASTHKFSKTTRELDATT